MAGRRPDGERILLFDDDHYYLGGVLAELLASEGKRVTLVTTAPRVSEWSVNTMEHVRIHARLVEAGVEIATPHPPVAGQARGPRGGPTHPPRRAQLPPH